MKSESDYFSTFQQHFNKNAQHCGKLEHAHLQGSDTRHPTCAARLECQLRYPPHNYSELKYDLHAENFRNATHKRRFRLRTLRIFCGALARSFHIFPSARSCARESTSYTGNWRISQEKTAAKGRRRDRSGRFEETLVYPDSNVYVT